MKTIITLLCLISSCFIQAQAYNPDSNNDGIIDTDDLLSFLAVYGSEFQFEEEELVFCPTPGNYVVLTNYPGCENYKMIGGDTPVLLVVLPSDRSDGDIVRIIGENGRGFNVYGQPDQELDDGNIYPPDYGEYRGYQMAEFIMICGSWYRMF